MELDFSGLGWSGVDHLVEALAATDAAMGVARACPRLKYLWLFDNPIAQPEEALQRLKAAIGEDVEISGLD